MTSTRRVIVVGGGITGLTGAYRLRRAGISVTVLERSDHVGGKAACVRRGGFTMNAGATLLSGAYREVLTLVDELGLTAEIAALEPRIGVFSESRQRVNWISRARPRIYRDLATTSILSFRDKIRLGRLAGDLRSARPLADYHRPDLQGQLDGETVAEYCRRRLNGDIERRLLAPLMTGLYLVDGSSVSTAGLFFSLLKLGGGTLGYCAGMDFICRALAEKVEVLTSAAVVSVRGSERGARVSWSHGGTEHDEDTDGAIVAVGPHAVPGLCPDLAVDTAACLTALPASTVFSMRLALSRPPNTDGTVIVAPHGALGGIGLITFDHNISPGSVPRGKAMLGVLLCHDWARARMSRSDDELLAEILPDLRRAVPGVAELIEFSHITRWNPAGLDGSVGTQLLTAQIAASIDPADRIQLAGEYLTIPGLEGSVVTANAAARRLAEAVGA